MTSPTHRPALAYGERTHVMGVINLTPDSFSDGGSIKGTGQALALAKRMVAQGATVLDLGAQSTRPGAEDIGVEAELARLLPALQLIRAALPQVLLSIDTFRAPVAAAALEAGADWLNDVSGGRLDPALFGVAAAWGCPLVLMHSRGDSRSMDSLSSYGELVGEVIGELQAASSRAQLAGVAASQLIWDPGLGFAKSEAQCLALLDGLPGLKAHGYPLLVGPSRKRFIGAVLNEPRPRARLWGTAAVVCKAIAAGADIVRVHDVGPIMQTARMADALWRSPGGCPG
jgi:dihydropteroate synthase